MVWDYVQTNVLQPYPRYPSPLHGMVSQIDVLACEDSFVAMMKIIAIEGADWWWSNFIPSPIEITRKTFTGGYKCGFYGTTKVKSPVDIIFRQELGLNKFGRHYLPMSRVIGGIVSPVTTGLFFMWISQTAWDFLSRWMSVIYAMQLCNTEGADIIWQNNAFPLFAGTYNPATIVNYGSLDGRHPDWGAPSAGVCTVPYPAGVRCTAGFRILGGHGNVHDLKVWISIDGEVKGMKDFGDPPENEPAEHFFDEGGIYDHAVACSVNFSCVVTGGAGIQAQFEVSPFVVYAGPMDGSRPGVVIWNPDGTTHPIEEPC